MATGEDICKAAAGKFGLNSVGDSLRQEHLNNLLAELNRMWSSWSAQLAPVYQHTMDSVTWTANSQSMTIGATGDLAVAKPVDIFGMQIRVGGYDYTLEKKSFVDYQKIYDKDLTNNYPEFFCYENTHPNGTIYIWRVPGSNGTARITSKKALTAFTLAGTVSLPEGYEHALVHNLAVIAAPDFGRQVLPSTEREARKSKKYIMQINRQTDEVLLSQRVPGMRTYKLDYDN